MRVLSNKQIFRSFSNLRIYVIWIFWGGSGGRSLDLSTMSKVASAPIPLSTVGPLKAKICNWNCLVVIQKCKLFLLSDSFFFLENQNERSLMRQFQMVPIEELQQINNGVYVLLFYTMYGEWVWVVIIVIVVIINFVYVASAMVTFWWRRCCLVACLDIIVCLFVLKQTSFYKHTRSSTVETLL